MNKVTLKTMAATLALAAAGVTHSGAGTFYSTTVLNDKPLAYWNFDEADGNAIQQASLGQKPVTSENDLVPTGGATRVSHAAIGSGLTKLGNAADLHGNDYFMAAGLRAGKAELGGAYAVEFWMQVQGDNTTDRQNYLANIGNNAPALIYDFKPDQLEMYAGTSRTDNGPVFNDTAWHHVLWVYYGDGVDGVADRVDAFLDGTPYQGIGNLFSKRMSLTQIIVGAALANGVNGFQGRLDELAIYDLSALPDEASVTAKVAGMVTSHLDAAKNASAPSYSSVVLGDSPTLYWNFDETDGNALQKAPITFPTLDNTRNDLAPTFNAQRITHAAAASGLQLGNAIDLDGLGSFFGKTDGLDVGRSSISGPWAVEFWFQLKGDQKMRYFLNMGANPNSPGIIYGYFGSRVEVFGNGRSGTNGVEVVDQNWHHLLLVNYNTTPATSSNRVDLYLDNVLYPNMGGDFRKAMDLQGWVLFGAAVPNPDPAQSGSMNARMDELALYDLSGYTNAAGLTTAMTAMAASHYAAAFGNASVGTITISGQPANVTAQRGGTASFSVTASVTGTTAPLTYQWQRNGVSINGATNATYTIPLVTIADIGTNVFRARVAAGPVFKFSSEATLIVAQPPPVPPTAYAQQVLADKPLFYWNFDEFTGPAHQQVTLVRAQPTTENDLVPTGSTADRVSHATLGDGLTKLGNAITLDGASFMRAEAMRMPKPALTNAYVLEMWAQAAGGASQYLVNFGPSGADNTPAFIYAFNANYYELYGAGPRTGTNGPSVTDNQWHHFVWVNYNSAPANSTNLVDVYLDGTLMANVGGGFNRNVDLRSVMVGAALPSAVNGFTGALDEFAVYDLAGLSLDQVRAKGASIATNHFATAKSAAGTSYSSVVMADNPILYYNFDEASGNAKQLMPVTLPALDNTVNDLLPAGAQRVEHSVLNDGLTLGNAGDLNGVSYFQVPALDAGQKTVVNAPWAVEFWMQVQGANTDNRQDYLLNFGNNNPAFIYDFKPDEPDQLEIFTGDRTGSGPTITDTSWHHVLWVFYGDGTVGVADRVDAFLDGTAVPNIRNTFSRALGVNGPFFVGAAIPGYNGFQGRLDEVAVYDLSSLGTESAVSAKIDQMVASHTAASKVQPAPRLGISVAANQLTLTWQGTGYVLQSTSTVAVPASWTDLPGAQTNPQVISPLPNVSTFYRLIKR